MSEEKKEEGCCGGAVKSGCGCGCGGIKKLVAVIVLASIVFTLGYMFGKHGCPFVGGSCEKKICPISK